MNPSRLYLAIDQGGHATRARVFNTAGATLAQAAVEVSERRPREERVEQDPEEVIASARKAIGLAVGALEPSKGTVEAAGLATQRASAVCWDRRTGAPLSTILSWQDRRAADRIEGLASQAGRIHEKTGLFPSAHYGASKLRWCLDHLPDVAAALREGRLSWGPLASFLARHLNGTPGDAADPANASRTLLWNLKTGTWDPWLLDLFGLTPDPLPHCVPSSHDWGTIATPHGPVPLTEVTGDQSAALFAWGNPPTSTAYINIGTGAFVQIPCPQGIASSGVTLHPHLLTSVAWSDGRRSIHAFEGTVNGAGSALAWLERRLGRTDLPGLLPSWLEVVRTPPLFLNGISGLGTPFFVPTFPSRFLSEGTPGEQGVAVVESILFLLQVNLEEARGAVGPLQRIIVSGGLSRLDGLCRRLADLTGLPVERPTECEATARGIAFLAAGQPEGWGTTDPPPDRFEPSGDGMIRERYAQWKEALLRALAQG